MQQVYDNVVTRKKYTFTERTLLFSFQNAAVSLVYWKLHQRSVMLTTGMFNSLLCLVGLTFQLDHPSLANGYVAAAAFNAAVQSGLHMAKTPALRTVSLQTLMFGGWTAYASMFALERFRWVLAYRGDS